MLESITIKDFKQTLDITLKSIYPKIEEEFDLLGNVKITFDDVLNQIIFLLIKKEYEQYAEKKSLRQHIENKHGKGSYNDFRRIYASGIKFINNHKSVTYNILKEKYNIEIPELLPKTFDTREEKLDGYKYTNVQFEELCMYVGRQKNNYLEEIHLLNKVYGHQIESSHKVSDSEFEDYFEQYHQYINNCIKQIDSDYKIIEKTIEYYQLEKSYSIDLSYSIVEEALKHNINSFSAEQLQYIKLLIMSYAYIPPTEFYPYTIQCSENYMILNKFDYVEEIFNQDELWWFFQLSAFFSSNRIIFKILKLTEINNLIKYFHEKISIQEKSSFIIDYYWLFSKHKKYDWKDSKKIKLYRKLKSQLNESIK